VLVATAFAFTSTGVVAVADAATVPSAPVGVAETILGSGLSHPSAVAADAAGDVYVADTGNGRLLKIDPAGTQTTLASGFLALAGVAVDAAGNAYVADARQDWVVKVAPDGTQSHVGSGFFATNCSGNCGPRAVAVDAVGNVYVGDVAHTDRVDKVAVDGTQSSIGYGLNWVFSLAVDGSGDVYAADFFNSRVVKIAPDGSTESTFGSGFSRPQGVAVDSAGNVFVADTDNFRVVALAPDGTALRNVDPYYVSRPTGVAVDGAGAVYVAEPFSTNHPLVKVVVTPGPAATGGADGSATITWAAPASDGGSPITTYTVTASDGSVPAHGGQTCFPASASTTCGVTGLTIGDSYTFTVTSSNGVGVSPPSAPSNPVTPPPPTAVAPTAPAGVTSTQDNVGSGFSLPQGVAVDMSGNIFVADCGIARVVKVAPDGTQTTVGSGFRCPHALALDPSGNLYVENGFEGALFEVAPSGAQNNVGPVRSGYDILSVAATAAGDVYEADGSSLFKVVHGDTVLRPIGVGGTPQAVAVDPTGNLYVGNQNSVLKIAPDGTQTTVAAGSLFGIQGMAVDAAGSLYVTSEGIYVNGGTVTKIARDGTRSSLGSGFNVPQGVAVDSAGDVFVADPYNGRVAEITMRPAATTSAPGSATVTWAAPLAEGSSAVTGYQVTATDTTASARGGQGCAPSPMTATTCTVSGLTNGDAYTFRVTATNTAGTSPASNPSSPVTPTRAAPNAPVISNLPVAGIYGGSFVASVTTNGDGVTSVTSSTPSVCTVGGGGLTVNYIGIGLCSLTAAVSAGANYTAASGTAQTLTVSSAVLTVSASSTSMAYLSSVPPIHATYSGLVNGDTATTIVTSAPACAAGAAAFSIVGSYPTTCSGGSFSANYSAIYRTGTLTILPPASSCAGGWQGTKEYTPRCESLLADPSVAPGASVTSSQPMSIVFTDGSSIAGGVLAPTALLSTGAYLPVIVSATASQPQHFVDTNGGSTSSRYQFRLSFSLPANLAPGVYTIRVTARDSEGDLDQWNWPVSIGGNGTQPALPAIVTGPVSPSQPLTAATTASFTFADSTGGSSYVCSMDAAAYVPCPSDLPMYAHLASGIHTLRAIAQLPSGAISAPSNPFVWTINAPQPAVESLLADPSASGIVRAGQALSLIYMDETPIAGGALAPTVQLSNGSYLPVTAASTSGQAAHFVDDNGGAKGTNSQTRLAFSLPSTLQPGVYVMQVTVHDGHGDMDQWNWYVLVTA
jgi:sugar lactone lactonase YvrE